MAFGQGVQITDDMIPDVGKQPEVMQGAADAGHLLDERLRSDHNRQQITAAMQKRLMKMMAHPS